VRGERVEEGARLSNLRQGLGQVHSNDSAPILFSGFDRISES